RQIGRARVRFVIESDPGEDLFGPAARLNGRALLPARAEHRADRDVVADGKLLQGLDDLKRSSDPEPADRIARKLRDVFSTKEDRPGSGLVQAGDAVDERRLSGAVG